MEYKPLSNNFSETDVTSINNIGYQIIGKGNIPFEKFMQRAFPNFNLVSLLNVVETHFTPTSQTAIIRKIYYDDSRNTLKIEYQNKYSSEDDALLFIREFSNSKGVIDIKHEFCVIPKNYRRTGLIKPVFQESLQQYINMNAKRILVHAGLSGGGYAWAKYGFAALNKTEVDLILNKAKLGLNQHDFSVVEKIYSIYYSRKPGGTSFPMDLWASLEFMKPILMGSDWHGELDLKNKEQFRNFKNYVSR